ncbi:MAG: protein kinase [Fibrobacteres bacterium]|nr:protein kinase [Fibrobacterota bacterium]
MPAALVSLALAAVVLIAGSHWGESAWYQAFARVAGPPPPSSTVLIITADPGADPWDAAARARLAATALSRGASVVALGPASSPIAAGADAIAGAPTDAPAAPAGRWVIPHTFARVRAWSFPENGPPAYPPILSRSLYPALDGPEPGLSLAMGEGLDIPDSLITEASAGPSAPTTGFILPAGEAAVWAVPAFIRLERGVAASLGVEAARRYLGVPAAKIGYVEGVGALFDASHALPIDASGAALPRFHAPDGIPHLSAQRFLESSGSASEARGKLVFLDPGGASLPTAAGLRTPTEVEASLSAGLLEGTLIAAPAWGAPLAALAGLCSAALMAAVLIAGFGGVPAFMMGAFLACVYPIVAFAAFAKASLWLPPQAPPLLVAAAYFPLAWARRSLTGRRAHPPMIHPAPAFDPVLMPMARPLPQPVTPMRGTPQVAIPAVRPIQGSAPAGRMAATESPSLMPPAPVASAPMPPASVAPAPLAQAPRNAEPPRPRPVLRERQGAPVERLAEPAAPSPAGDEIERDAKGGLVRVGKYRIVRKMGFGSAGDVFEGFDSQMGRKVAIKTITRFASSRFDRAGERFVLEARAAGSLNHPCINTIYDFGTIRDVSYMVLEFLDGVTLSQWMRAHPQPPHPRAVAHWMRQIASALDFAHSHKIIHRDLKPANLMVVDNGATLKLLDFGIAKMEDMGLTATGMTVGTPSYMSPEQLAGANVGPASDQYGFAVVLYQLLSYRLPYIGTKIPELCNRILKNEIVPLDEVSPALGGAFWGALRKAMGKTPEERYPDCMALYTALAETMPA